MPVDTGKLEGWCIVAQMGHRTLIGEVKQVNIGETALLRIDIPEFTRKVRTWNESGNYVTEEHTYPARFEVISPASIYSITPVSEEVARKTLMDHGTSVPAFVEPKVRELAGREQLALPGPAREDDHYDVYEDDDEDDDDEL